MRDDLLIQLEEWHEEDKYQSIVDAVQAIPTEERNYELVNHLGRALNNLERYEEAVEQFLTVAEEGKDDALWHYRIGLAYYYLEQYDRAEEAFERSDELEPGDEDTLEFLEWIRNNDGDESDEETETEEDSESEDESGLDSESIEEAATSAPTVPTVQLNENFDPTHFWNDSEQALEQYVSNPPSEGLIASVEEELVFRLPESYVEMMKNHNGGVPNNRYFPIGATDSGVEEYIELKGILGIGREKPNSLCGSAGSWALIEQGGYPEFGVVLSECASQSGVVMLDYRSAGNDAEPEVVHVDKDNQYKVTTLAPNFETFVQGLVHREV